MMNQSKKRREKQEEMKQRSSRSGGGSMNFRRRQMRNKRPVYPLMTKIVGVCVVIMSLVGIFSSPDYGGLVIDYADERTAFDASIADADADAGGGTKTAAEAAIDELLAAHDNDNNDDKKTKITASLRIILGILKSYNPPTPTNSMTALTAEQQQEETERCARYGFEFKPSILPNGKRRRIFMGTSIADDSWHAIGNHAMEAHNLYHTVVFSESNNTFMLTKRETRYVDDGDGDAKTPSSPQKARNKKVLQSIFGPSTNVVVHNFIGDWHDLQNNTSAREIRGFTWEHMQRQPALQIWKENGMTPQDIGIISDVDEVFTRDFLIAAQTCDVPKFRPGQDCRSPKLVASTISFETSPECAKEKRWFHPDMIIGECIEGIGSSSDRVPAFRSFKNSGCRPHGKGKQQSDYKLAPLNETEWSDNYPLWNAGDFRCTEGGDQFHELGADGRRSSNTHIAYHLHNFFVNSEELRKKYRSYSHATEKAASQPIGTLKFGDLNVALECLFEGRPPDDADGERLLNGGKFENMPGRRPILFENEEYRRARHEDVRKMFEEDESKYGTRNFTKEEQEDDDGEE